MDRAAATDTCANAPVDDWIAFPSRSVCGFRQSAALTSVSTATGTSRAVCKMSTIGHFCQAIFGVERMWP